MDLDGLHQQEFGSAFCRGELYKIILALKLLKEMIPENRF